MTTSTSNSDLAPLSAAELEEMLLTEQHSMFTLTAAEDQEFQELQALLALGPKKPAKTPRDYQEEAINFLMYHVNPNGLLKNACHDQWGLGKTFESTEAAVRLLAIARDKITSYDAFMLLLAEGKTSQPPEHITILEPKKVTTKTYTVVFDESTGEQTTEETGSSTEIKQVPRQVINPDFIQWQENYPSVPTDLERAQNGKVLVVCPSYLVQQWYNFITGDIDNEAQYPDLSCTMVTGSLANRVQALMQFSDITIVNKEMVRQFTIPPVYTTVIIDEAHWFRKGDADMSKAMAKLCDMTPHVIELTATPVMKEPDDLFWQLRMLGMYSDRQYAEWCIDYCYIQGAGRGGIKVTGGRTAKITRLLESCAIGRKYQQVKMYLPRLVEDIVTVPMSEDTRKRYITCKDYWQDILQATTNEDGTPNQRRYMSAAIAVLQRLRQITMCEEKISAILDIVNDIGPSSDTVIFTWYKDGAHRIADALNQQALQNWDSTSEPAPETIPVITGDVKAELRGYIAKNKHIVVATISSLSEGVDLSSAKNVIFAEEWYVAGAIQQALARVRRWSENHGNVNVRYVHMDHTVDQVLHDIQKRRNANMRDIMRLVLDDE